MNLIGRIVCMEKLELHRDCIKFLGLYKILKCERQDCVYNVVGSSEIGKLYDCFGYHDRHDDKRRPPIALEREYVRICYSDQFMPDDRGKAPNPRDCLTGFEYVFHPFVYKSSPCVTLTPERQESLGCEAGEYCPYYHNEKERLKYENFRDTLSKLREDNEPHDEKARQMKEFNADMNLALQQSLPATKLLESEIYVTHSKKRPKDGNYLVERHEFVAGQEHYVKWRHATKLDTNRCIYEDYEENELYKLTKHICGFLNHARGGTIYLGLDSSLKVVGAKFNRSKKDEFQRLLDESLKKFSPIVHPDEYTIKFVEILDDKSKDILTNSYVVEVKITPHTKDTVYITNYEEAFVFENGEFILLKPYELKTRIETKLIENLNPEEALLLEQLKEYSAEPNLNQLPNDKLKHIIATLEHSLAKIDRALQD